MATATADPPEPDDPEPDDPDDPDIVEPKTDPVEDRPLSASERRWLADYAVAPKEVRDRLDPLTRQAKPPKGKR